MYFLLIIPILLLVCLHLMPEGFWDVSLHFFIYAKHRFKLIFSLPETMMVSRRGEQLMGQLARLATSLSTGRLGSKIELYQYKFYTELVFTLLDYKRQYGIHLEPIMQKLRQAVKVDYQFERKLESELLSGIVQFLFVSLITWFFSFLVRYFISVRITTINVFIIILLQSLGFVSFIIINRIYKKRKFLVFEAYLKGLYSLSSLMEIGLSTNKILACSNISTLFKVNDKAFELIDSKLYHLVSAWKQDGTPIKREIDEIIQEVNYLQDERFTRFLRFLGILKFGILCVFFLSAYFIYLFGLFSTFMMD